MQSTTLRDALAGYASMSPWQVVTHIKTMYHMGDITDSELGTVAAFSRQHLGLSACHTRAIRRAPLFRVETYAPQVTKLVGHSMPDVTNQQPHYVPPPNGSIIYEGKTIPPLHENWESTCKQLVCTNWKTPEHGALSKNGDGSENAGIVPMGVPCEQLAVGREQQEASTSYDGLNLSDIFDEEWSLDITSRPALDLMTHVPIAEIFPYRFGNFEQSEDALNCMTDRRWAEGRCLDCNHLYDWKHLRGNCSGCVGDLSLLQQVGEFLNHTHHLQLRVGKTVLQYGRGQTRCRRRRGKGTRA